MLLGLHVKNLALIEKAEVEFTGGLNILTGETGAGKSILIGSVGLALGGKASKDMIRQGEDSALVMMRRKKTLWRPWTSRPTRTASLSFLKRSPRPGRSAGSTTRR